MSPAAPGGVDRARQHPSALALDRHALGVTDGAVEAHLAGCGACRAQVDAARVEVPVPAWVQGQAAAVTSAAATGASLLLGRSEPRGPRRWLALAFAAAAGAALASLVALVVVDGARGPGAVTPKGSPSVTVWVKRGDRVAPWQGAPLRAGDAVRLEVMPAGYAHLAVVSAPGTQAATVLYQAALEAGPALTPAWALDATPGAETLLVVLSQEPLAEAELLRGPDRRDAEVWSVREVLPREVP